jgi:hypothetical protein
MTAEYELPEGMTVEQDDYLNEVFQRLYRLSDGLRRISDLLPVVRSWHHTPKFESLIVEMIDQTVTASRSLVIGNFFSSPFPHGCKPDFLILTAVKGFAYMAGTVSKLAYALLPKYAANHPPGWALEKTGEPVFFKAVSRLEQAVIKYGLELQPLVRESLKSLTAMADHLGSLDD